jgi:hypothetical protein
MSCNLAVLRFEYGQATIATNYRQTVFSKGRSNAFDVVGSDMAAGIIGSPVPNTLRDGHARQSLLLVDSVLDSARSQIRILAGENFLHAAPCHSACGVWR